MITLQAPAKLNLTLEVLGKRPDGYHEIRSVIQTVGLFDTLTLEAHQGIQFTSDLPDWDSEKSLVSKAAVLLKNMSGSKKGSAIRVIKRIPLVSGLGGDSSDAAAVLWGLNELWELGLSIKELSELAQQLGSDVPFFLYGGTALMKGRGEIVTPLPPIDNRFVLIMVPHISRPPNKTARLYASLQPSFFTDGKLTGALADLIRAGKEVPAECLFNTFENITFAPSAELRVFRSHILKIGATNVHLAGSGPALFTVLNNREEGEDLCIRLQAQGMELHLVETTRPG